MADFCQCAARILAPAPNLSTMARKQSMLCIQGYGGDYQREDNLTAYQAIVDEGITFIDTAEVMLLADFL